MSSIKKTVVFVMSLVMLFSASLMVAAEPIVIEYWHAFASGKVYDAIVEIVDGFNNSQDKIFVEHKYQGGYDALAAKVMQSIPAGTTPDVAILDWPYLAKFEPYNIFYPMDEYVEKSNLDISDFVAGLLECCYTRDGKLIALPFNRSTPIMYYNKDAFREVGLDPERGPQTWDEFYEYSLKLYKEENGEVVRYGSSMNFDAGWFLAAMIGQAGGKVVTDDGQASMIFADGTLQKSLEFWRSLRDSGTYRQPTTTSAESTMLQDFYNGKVGMIWQSTGTLTQALENVTFELGVDYLPRNVRRHVPTGGCSIVMFNTSPKDKLDAAWEFIEYATNTENAAKFSRATGYVTTRYSSTKTDVIQELWAEYPQYKRAFDQLEHAHTWEYSEYFADYCDPLDNTVELLIKEGNIDVREAMELIRYEAIRLFPGNTEANTQIIWHD